MGAACVKGGCCVCEGCVVCVRGGCCACEGWVLCV